MIKKETHTLLKRTFRDCHKPVAYNIPSGHCNPLITLPLGAYVTLNPSTNSLSIQQGCSRKKEKTIKS